MPETPAELAVDSRWPALFPSPICIATTSHGGVAHVEKVVGATIVNRFPYIVALSVCREPLSERHHVRHAFMEAVEASRHVAVQFLMPGAALEALMRALASTPQDRQADRFAAAGLPVRPALTSAAPVFDAAYLVYEGQFVEPGVDFEGVPTNGRPWMDVGSHRIYLFEVTDIALREDIASGQAPLQWRSLPAWRGGPSPSSADRSRPHRAAMLAASPYVKTYQPDYVFPASSTVAFAADARRDGRFVKHLEPLAPGRIAVDNDLARWPCFFPSSLGLITVEGRDGRIGGLACGSTAVVSRHPMAIAICVSYAPINERYGRRASLDLLASAERFGCGVPVHRPDVLEAITYLGNVSLRQDPDKIANCGLTPRRLGASIGFEELPVHYDCRIVHRVPLGTHVMVIGEVERVIVRTDVNAGHPLEWCPWAGRLSP
jgi:flavin reductase (DIM6/NTAB) family NADH-FMN oxidoreductase RutF